MVLELEDTWLLARLPPVRELRDVCRGLSGWALALVLLCLQLMPFVLGFGLLRLLRQGRFVRRQVHGMRRRVRSIFVFKPVDRTCISAGVRLFYALGLDLTPRLAGAVCGQWWLCGQEPLRAPEENALRHELMPYFPAVFSYATVRCGREEPDVAAMEARCYIQNRSLMEDLRMLRDAFAGRIEVLVRRGHLP